MFKPMSSRYRTTNWPAYNASHKRHSSLSVWFDPNMGWYLVRTGKRGHPETFSDCAIQACPTLKVLLGLPLRHAAGLIASLIRRAGLGRPVPGYSTLCRRQARIAVRSRIGAPASP